jgi:hypothetical protein
MQRVALIGPSLEELRPIKAVSPAPGGSASFPVYDELARALHAIKQNPMQPHAIARHVCTVLSSWFYSDPQTLLNMVARLGLPRSRCVQAEVSNNALLIRSAAYLVQSRCRRVVVLGYRGTDPFDVSTWAVSTDANAVPVPVRDNTAPRIADDSLPVKAGAARVHGGWYRNQRATWFAITPALRAAARGQSILSEAEFKAWAATQDAAAVDAERVYQAELDAQTIEPVLFITGHSLGGAMGILAAYKLATDPDYAELYAMFGQVYTFGQPMVGNFEFGQAFADAGGGGLGRRVFCHQCRAPERDASLVSTVVRKLVPGAVEQPAVAAAKKLAAQVADRSWPALLKSASPALLAASKPISKMVESVVPATWVRDVVPHLPSEDVGTFVHVGRHFHAIKRSSDDPSLPALGWSDELPAAEIPHQASSLLSLAIAALGYVADQLPLIGTLLARAQATGDALRSGQRLAALVPQLGFLKLVEEGRFSLYQHLPSHYIACSQPNGVLTEFGDDF